MARDTAKKPVTRGRRRESRRKKWGRRARWYFQRLTDKTSSKKRRLGYLAAGLAAVGATLFLFVFLYALVLYPFTPGVSELRKAKAERPTIVYSADGVKLAEFKPVNREWVGLDEISDHVVEALIATEDHRFYDHSGVDVIRMLGAFYHTVTGDPQGASTITQQLARNLYPDQIGRSRSLTRKLKEIITALKIERVYTKDEILQTYLNTVPFLYNAFGIEMAARTYFDKSASDLNVLESATLVGMLKGTWYYNPVRHPARSTERRNIVLRQMVKRGYLEEGEYEELKDEPLEVSFERQPVLHSRAPHFTEYVRSWLTKWADRHGYNIYRDSLVVYTTLDMRLQEHAERAIDRQLSLLQQIADVEWGRSSGERLSRSPAAYASYHGRTKPFEYYWETRQDVVTAFIRGTSEFRSGVEAGFEEGKLLDSLRSDEAFMRALKEVKTRLEAGFVALDPQTGHVKAWVGSRDYKTDRYDHVAQARRQPGSTFKPFVYAAALEKGFRPEDTLPDEKVEIRLRNNQVWSPGNTGDFSGREISLTDGLVYSKNGITAQLIDRVGVRDVARLARKMGIRKSRLDEVPSLALGTSEVSLLEMASAYGTFASGGIYHEPLVVTRIEKNGEVIATFEPEGQRVLSEETAYAVVDMMRGVVDRGTGRRIRETFGIREDVAGKTGTSQNNADGWFILIHPEIVAGAWVGFNDPRVAFRTDYWGQGGNNAVLVVGDFFRRAARSGSLDERYAEFPPAPEFEEKSSVIDRIGRWLKDKLGKSEEDDAGRRVDVDLERDLGPIIRRVGKWVETSLNQLWQALDDLGNERFEVRRPVRAETTAKNETSEPSDAGEEETWDESFDEAEELNRRERDSKRLRDLIRVIEEAAAELDELENVDSDE